MGSTATAGSRVWVRAALSALPGAVAFALVHAVQLGRHEPMLGRWAIPIGVLAGVVFLALDLGLGRGVRIVQRWLAQEDPEERTAALAVVLRIYPFLLLVQEYFVTRHSGFNTSTRNFLVLQSMNTLLLCHLTVAVSLAALAVVRFRVERLRTAIALLIAVNFVAYFFREQGEYWRINVIRSIVEFDTIEGPWRHRLLVPALLQGLAKVGLVGRYTIFSALFVTSVPLVFFTILFLSDALEKVRPGGFWLAALSPLLLVFGFDVIYITTLPEVFFAALFLRYALTQRFWPALVTLGFGVLNRESFAVFGLTYLLFAWEADRFRLTRSLLGQALAFAGVVAGLRLSTYLILGPHKVLEWHLPENLRHLRHYGEALLGRRPLVYSPYHHSNFVYAINKQLVVLASLPLAAFVFGRHGPRRLLLAFGVVYVLYLTLILLFGMINESRMMFVTVPLVLATLHGALGNRDGEPLAGEGAGS